MCGIIGILGKEAVAMQVVEALRRLEYRGYDSAGLATLEAGKLTRHRAQGKLQNLEVRLSNEPLQGLIGIGHTRWATHGKPTEANAHPHATEKLAVVHNGIIENFRELRAELAHDGYICETETDTEIVAHLVTRELDCGMTPIEAVAASLPRLHGTFALAFLFQSEEDLLIGARKGSPLAVGIGDGEMYLGSDALALAPFTNMITYLEEGDWVVLNRRGATFYDKNNTRVERDAQQISVGAFLAEKGQNRHFMEKEIYEQPEAVSRTLAQYLDPAANVIRLPFADQINWASLSRLSICGCGTAYYAGLVAKYWFETLARLPVETDIASEFRYRAPPLQANGLALFISQSGETADTLACLRYAREQEQAILSVVNVSSSTIARESDAVAPTLAGPEISVASTKGFTCQLVTLACLALAAAHSRGCLSEPAIKRHIEGLSALPNLLAKAFQSEFQIKRIARELAKAKDVIYLGRGTSFPLALEGALKLKELSYIHAEGYAAGELKHGPIALVDEAVPVIVVAPYDRLFTKTVSNMHEVAARGGRVILVSDARGVAESGIAPDMAIVMPEMDPVFAPIVYALPMQMIGYHTAAFLGKDIDQPRNLAKSVTVE